MAMNALANEMGRDRLRVAFREILRDFRDHRLSWEDFLAVVTGAAGREMSWFYAQWFQRTGAPELWRSSWIQRDRSGCASRAILIG